MAKRVACSFSSSGLLLPYHLGVAEALQRSQALEIAEVHGVSGGALAGAVLLLGPDCLERARKAMATRVRPTCGELWDPAILIPRIVREHDIFPTDAYSRLSGRLHVYTTLGGMMRNTKKHVVSTFRSNDELLTWIQASCSFAWEGVLIDGVAHWDGGCCGCYVERSATLPTVASSVVWKDDAEICPPKGRFGFDLWGFRVDAPSLRAGWDCCFMFSPDRMMRYWRSGELHAEAYLHSLDEQVLGPASQP